MDAHDLFLCPICSNIPDNQRGHFVRALTFKTKFFEKGARIAGQGDPVHALYTLLEGSVKAEMVSESGTVLNVEVIRAPNPLAPAFLFAKNNRFPVDVVALEPCKLIIISKESVIKQLASNETFLQGFMTYNSDRVHFLSERLKLLSTKTIKGKLAQYILARTKHMDFVLDMNQTALSEYFGITRPSLSRSLSEMMHEGIISLKGKRGKVLDLGKLRKAIMQ